jgi:Ca-activated chloride channel family protein
MVQIAPGVYEVPLGEIDPGAYAVRVTQTKAGTTPLGRTVGLVAPTAAEYRVLGANEPFLAAVRTATGGSPIQTPLDPWIHDLDQTSRFTDLWPLLLVLALLLWPLDIALRRVSLGRREFAAAGSWVRTLPRRRRRVAARTSTGESLLAARERASSMETRAAIRASAAAPATGAPAPTAGASATVSTATDPATPGPAPAPMPPPTTAATAPPPAAPAPRPAAPAPPPAAPASPPAPAAEPADTISRLRDAKRRARER